MEPDILNNLDQFNDVEEIDENAMVTDARPLPPAGVYNIRLSLEQDGAKEKAILKTEFPANNISTFTTQDGKKHLMIVIRRTIVSDNPKLDGQRTNEWASTMVMKGTQTSAVDTYLRLLTGRAGVGLTTGQKIKALYDAIATEPVIVAEIDWRGESPKKDREGNNVVNKNGKNEYAAATVGGRRLTTMTNFPRNEDGSYISADLEDENGEAVFVNWDIKKFVSGPGTQQFAGNGQMAG